VNLSLIRPAIMSRTRISFPVDGFIGNHLYELVGFVLVEFALAALVVSQNPPARTKDKL
jgi:hypothetical protein